MMNLFRNSIFIIQIYYVCWRTKALNISKKLIVFPTCDLLATAG